MVKKLVVNADDFGLCKEINEGIIECFRKGIVSSASIMANFDLNKLPEEKKLGLGVHLNVTKGKSLVTGNNFPNKMWTRALFIKTKKKLIEEEFRKQIDKLKELGYKLDHLNTHQHIHTLSPVRNIVYKLAREYKIKYVRHPKEALDKFSTNNLFEYSIARSNMRKFPDDLSCAKNFFGFLDTGNPKIENFLRYLNFEESAEIMCHPSLKGSSENNKVTRVGYKEMRILTNPVLKEEIEERKIKLVTCKELW